ncbi:unnamed protein product [Orchesella dallaii]|uniref:Uncharacterized protein n=1 Tax=Orchesella dallaii TaxID=48710 RepID=A0ABP1QWM3_9HEXA
MALMCHLKKEQNHKQDLGYPAHNNTVDPTKKTLVPPLDCCPISNSEGSLQRNRRPNEIDRLQTKLQRPLNSVEIDNLYKGYRKLENCTKRRNCECYHCQLFKSTLNDDSTASNDSTSDSDNEVISTIFCECFSNQAKPVVFKNKVFGATQEFNVKTISDEPNTLSIPIFNQRYFACVKKAKVILEKLFNVVTTSFRFIGTLPIGVVTAGVKLLCHVLTILLSAMCRRRRFRKTHPDIEGKLGSVEQKQHEDYSHDILSEVTVHQTP